ncbi:hypothetical protein K4F52_000412 [Lecanicillium sp. MT-2017a]|nr:hypothetical protein K4F52_000412 [Lecanicillium sp. MT-2017a]
MQFGPRKTGPLVAALLISSMDLATAKSKDEYASESVQAIRALQSNWYNENTGLWHDAWWNSGNALTTLADFGKLRPGDAVGPNIKRIIQNTFVRAQQASVYTYKTMGHQGMVSTQSCVNGQGDCFDEHEGLAKRSFPYFLNHYYDDEGWWALGLIHAYDYAGNKQYLDAAVRIFQDMQTGEGGPCNGGIYWNKDRQYVNAIANELYLSVAASLANRIPADKAHYTKIAEDQWRWFDNSGMISSQNLINDGLTSDCSNNGGVTWSYNQGVVLGGLTDLYHATGNGEYLRRAATIANAAIGRLSDSNGVLVEANRCEFDSSRCGHDGQQFKGIFIRNLRYLHATAPNDDYKNFILRNANSIWGKDRDSSNKLGVSWGGPYYGATGMTQSSALDALVAAVAVA